MQENAAYASSSRQQPPQEVNITPPEVIPPEDVIAPAEYEEDEAEFYETIQ